MFESSSWVDAGVMNGHDVNQMGLCSTLSISKREWWNLCGIVLKEYSIKWYCIMLIKNVWMSQFLGWPLWSWSLLRGCWRTFRRSRCWSLHDRCNEHNTKTEAKDSESKMHSELWNEIELGDCWIWWDSTPLLTNNCENTQGPLNFAGSCQHLPTADKVLTKITWN